MKEDGFQPAPVPVSPKAPPKGSARLVARGSGPAEVPSPALSRSLRSLSLSPKAAAPPWTAVRGPGAEQLEELLEPPKLVITEQPKQRGMRFRYECEGRSAGSILGESSTEASKTLPAIEIEAAIERKLQLGIDPFKAGSLKNHQEVDMNVVRICFQASYTDSAGRRRQLSPVLSEPIFDKKDIAVVFRKETWEARADFSQADVHRQVAIVLKTPPYQQLELAEPVEVEGSLPTDAYGVNVKRKRGMPEVLEELSGSDPYGIEAKRRKKPPGYMEHFAPLPTAEDAFALLATEPEPLDTLSQLYVPLAPPGLPPPYPIMDFPELLGEPYASPPQAAPPDPHPTASLVGTHMFPGHYKDTDLRLGGRLSPAPYPKISSLKLGGGGGSFCTPQHTPGCADPPSTPRLAPLCTIFIGGGRCGGPPGWGGTWGGPPRWGGTCVGHCEGPLALGGDRGNKAVGDTVASEWPGGLGGLG
ncbi:transcription factor RelB-like protein, partial [Columba guinea]